MSQHTQTRIKLKTQFQDSYLQERNRQTQLKLIEEVKEVEMEIEIQKATHNFLMRMMKGTINHRPNKELETTISQFLNSSNQYVQMMQTMSKNQRI